MIIFEAIKSYFALAGLNPNQPTCNHPFNIKTVAVGVGFGVAAILSLMFFLHEASSFEEYSNSFYLLSTGNFTVLCFIILVWKKQKLFVFVESIENLIDERELTCCRTFEMV